MNRALERAGFTDGYFDAGEARIHYLEGPAGGPALVLVHAQAMTCESYVRVAPDLARDFHVFLFDVRGHGLSSWTPGDYTWDSMSRDLERFVREVVREPVIVSGNSSGGTMACWLAAEAPDLVLAIAPEDPALLSVDGERIKDCYVYRIFELCVETLDRPEGRDLAAFFDGLVIPSENGKRTMKLPKPLVHLLAAYLRRHSVPDGSPVDIWWLPAETRAFAKGLSMYDPAFTRAFWDGSAQEGFSHEAMLARVRCPMLLIHADWFRHPDLGLVGAMDDDDVARARELVPHMRYRHIHAGHVIHMQKPAEFAAAIRELAASLTRREGAEAPVGAARR
ncbi:MAG TPA: alpha/beta hydrolase [Coriobacteriia bacterium]